MIRLSKGFMAALLLSPLYALATSTNSAGTDPWPLFQSVSRPQVPRVDSKWARNPIDSFIAAQQKEKKLQPRPEASKEILLRRIYLDLIGLVPTPEQQQAFLSDTSPQAYERTVDRLLDDPRYGERWGRHWMDVWRYSDWAGWSGGNQIRDSKPHIWRWKDWIIESLNQDKPYDQFVRAQVTGYRTTERTQMTATGRRVRLEPRPDDMFALGFLILALATGYVHSAPRAEEESPRRAQMPVGAAPAGAASAR